MAVALGGVAVGVGVGGWSLAGSFELRGDMY